MAGINWSHIEKVDKQRYTIHEEIDATYSIFEKDGVKYLQIDTYGSSKRELSHKVSQSIQLNKDSVIDLVNILKNEFLID